LEAPVTREEERLLLGANVAVARDLLAQVDGSAEPQIRVTVCEAVSFARCIAEVTKPLTREQAVEFAREAAKAKPQSYYAEPFEPHEWVVDAILAAGNRNAVEL
jgi:hypothetical protein